MLSLFALSAQAKETVTILYGFGAGDSITTAGRTMAEEANKIQNKYTFVFDVKPGAGSSIAANYVANTPNTILFISSAFFVRPHFYPESSQDINKFRALMPVCQSPMAVGSVKYKSWDEVPATRQLNIATSGVGVVSHLIAAKIIEKHPNILVIPFKSTADAVMSTVGGQTDFAVSFIGDQEIWENKNPSMHILGISGPKTVNGHPALANIGFSKILAESNQVHQLMVSVDTPEKKFNEWREILVNAAKTKTVRDTYKMDYCIPLSDMSESDLQPFFYKQAVRWKSLSSGVKIN